MTLLLIEIGTAILFISAIALLLLFSAIISGSESAIFSTQNSDITELPESKAKSGLIKVLSMPKRILATILLSNNAINVAFVLIAARFIDVLMGEGGLAKKIVQISVETILLLLFGEIIPKIYATINHVQFGLKVAPFLLFLKKILNPFVTAMVRLTKFIDKRFDGIQKTVSIDELSQAIDITSDHEAPKEEKEILKSIIRFGNLSASQIMTSRTEMQVISSEEKSQDVMKIILDKGFSRMPVYGENLDDILGILYVKDLLKYTDRDEEFEWHRLIRPALFIHEKMRIDDLLAQFQEKRIHMAIVVDEFGGTEGLVTMEDILEQIFGEIMDEFDEVDISYSKLDDNKFIFSAQTMLTDVINIAKLEGDVFEDHMEEADTLAGLLMEIEGEIPRKGTVIQFKHLEFTVESANNRKLNRIKLLIGKESEV